MEIPGLGTVVKDTQFGEYCSAQMPVLVLGGKMCRLVIPSDYDHDPHKADYHRAIANFLQIQPHILKDAELHVFRYYQNCNSYWEPGDDDFLTIPSPGEVWKHVQFGSEPAFIRRARGDRGIYVSLECNCDWEPEHGLQIVFKDGLCVTKVGPFDGHLTNSDAYANDALEDVIYHEF